MNIERKTEEWRAAGLIDAETAARLVSHEQSRPQRPVVLWALAALGAATVALGLVAIIAANWEGISGPAKLAVDGVLLACLAGGIVLSEQRSRSLVTEVLVTLMYPFTMASLALVGQVYQLGSPPWQALTAWTLFTAPLVTLGRSRFLGVLWFAGVTLTYVTGFVALVEFLEGRVTEQVLENAATVVAYASPLLFLSFARLPFLVRQREVLMGAFASAAWLVVAGASVMMPVLWYEGRGERLQLGWAVLGTGVITVAWYLSLPWLLPRISSALRRGVGVLMAFSWLSASLALLLTRDDWPAVGAISQVLVLGGLAWLAAQARWLRLFHTLTALVALRLLVAYFEVFGSLMDTGLGLVTGGALALLMAWVWQKRIRDLPSELHTEDGHVA